MTRSHFALWSTTALTAALLATPALAQDTQPVTPPNPNATAQQNPSEPAQNADAPQSPAAEAGTDNSAIVVTGLRRSLQSARNIKRNSEQIVDAVVAEDIGKLPDITVSDTAARIPGVQVERNGGEASRVLIRGLDNTYYTTTYNSRELFTAETRSVALQDFPAGAVGAIEVFKTSTANLIEPGLAGLVNVRSRRPFDFKGFEIDGSIWGVRPNESRDPSVNGNLLVTDRWRVGDGEFGALLNFSYTTLHYQDSVRRHGFFIADLDGYRSPDWPELHYNEGDRWRPSLNGALQYRIGDLELYAEGLWQGYRERVTDREWAQPLWNCGQATYSNITLRNGTNDIASGSVTNPGCDAGNGAWGFQGATHRETNTYQFAGGGSYNAGRLHISADLAHTYSHFQLRTESVDEQLANNHYAVNWYTGSPGGNGPTFQVTGLDTTDPANYEYRGFFEDYQDPKGKDWQGRVDFDLDPGIAFVPKIQWGIRYVDRDASDQAGSFYWNAGGLHIPISDVPLDYVLHHPAFRGDNMPPSPITWLSPSYSSVWSNLTAFRQWNIDQLGVGSVDGPPIDPSRSFAINEKSLAGYAQLNIRAGGADTYLDGLIGVRALHTTDNIGGSEFLPNGTVAPVDYHSKGTTWLPNLNLNFHAGPSWIVRFAATKTETRPTFQQLNPSLHLGEAPVCGPTSSGCFRLASGGNPFLKPLKSNNYDASVEYYFSNTGFASLGAYRRDMRGFIVNQQFQAPELDPECNCALLITGPVNTQKSRMQGFEGQIRTFFDFGFMPAWARSFGIDANFSYIDTKAKFSLLCDPNGLNCSVNRTLPLPDVSKWNYNITGMYENGPLSVRLSYNWRGVYPEGALSQQGTYTLQGRAHASPRLDLSTSFNLRDNLTLFADWTNIFPKPFKSDIVRVNYANGQPTSTEEFPMIVRFEETVLSAGIRFRFGGGTPAVAPPPPPVMPPPPPTPATQTCPDGTVVLATDGCPPPPPGPPPPPPPAAGERGR